MQAGAHNVCINDTKRAKATTGKKLNRLAHDNREREINQTVILLFFPRIFFSLFRLARSQYTFGRIFPSLIQLGEKLFRVALIPTPLG